MNKIVLNNLKQEEFAREIKKLRIDDEMHFVINDSVANNIEILMYYLKYKKVKKVIFDKESENIDFLCYRNFVIYFQRYYLFTSNFIEIVFEGYLHEELKLLLDERFYLNYCKHQGIEPKWNENYLKKEKRKVEKNKHLLKYDIFKRLVEVQENMPYSYFNIPEQDNYDRFVFYFHMYSNERRNKILELVEDLGIDKYEKLVELIETNKINDEIFYYAIGFVYKDEKLIRVSLYTKFAGNIIHRDGIEEFLKRKHDLELEEEHRNLWYYAVDFYDNGIEEIKIYDEPYIFVKEINDKKINNLLHKRPCVKVSKYRYSKKIDEKYEFEFKKAFRENELERLRDLGLYRDNKKIVAIYLDNDEIRERVFYEL